MSTIILLNDVTYRLRKEQAAGYLEELLFASHKFVGSKEPEVFHTIVTGILTDKFEEVVQLELYKDALQRETYLHDLYLLAAMWVELKAIVMKAQTMDSNLMHHPRGSSVIQDIANHTGKMIHKRYPEENGGAVVLDRLMRQRFGLTA
jgi:hypothetical protein